MLDDVIKGAVEGVVKAMMSGRDKPDGRIVEAEGFVLRDQAKNVRGMFTYLPEGPALVLINPDQEIQAILATHDDHDAAYLQIRCVHNTAQKVVVMANPEGPQVFLHDRNENVQARLLGEPDAVSLELNAEDQHTKVVLRVDPDHPSLFFRDGNSQTRAEINLTPGGPALTFLDEQGRCRAHLLLEGGAPLLVLLDESGQEQARLPASS
jgi:hypothetical protein